MTPDTPSAPLTMEQRVARTVEIAIGQASGVDVSIKHDPVAHALFNAILNEIRVAESALAAMTAERDEIAGKASTMVVRAMAAEDALEQAVADRDAAREQRDNLAAALASGSAQKEGE